jgi:hypothetical protein
VRFFHGAGNLHTQAQYFVGKFSLICHTLIKAVVFDTFGQRLWKREVFIESNSVLLELESKKGCDYVFVGRGADSLVYLACEPVSNILFIYCRMIRHLGDQTGSHFSQQHPQRLGHFHFSDQWSCYHLLLLVAVFMGKYDSLLVVRLGWL